MIVIVVARSRLLNLVRRSSGLRFRTRCCINHGVFTGELQFLDDVYRNHDAFFSSQILGFADMVCGEIAEDQHARGVEGENHTRLFDIWHSGGVQSKAYGLPSR